MHTCLTFTLHMFSIQQYIIKNRQKSSIARTISHLLISWTTLRELIYIGVSRWIIVLAQNYVMFSAIKWLYFVRNSETHTKLENNRHLDSADTKLRHRKYVIERKTTKYNIVRTLPNPNRIIVVTNTKPMTPTTRHCCLILVIVA